LSLKAITEGKGPFEILESAGIAPKGGWAKSEPETEITEEEMEEVRCSIALAAEEGEIPVEADEVTADVNQFSDDMSANIAAVEDAKIVKDRKSRSAETGYQGGSGVTSTPF
jgi:hypothetical protein